MPTGKGLYPIVQIFLMHGQAGQTMTGLSRFQLFNFSALAFRLAILRWPYMPHSRFLGHFLRKMPLIGCVSQA